MKLRWPVIKERLFPCVRAGTGSEEVGGTVRSMLPPFLLYGVGAGAPRVGTGEPGA